MRKISNPKFRELAKKKQAPLKSLIEEFKSDRSRGNSIIPATFLNPQLNPNNPNHNPHYKNNEALDYSKQGIDIKSNRQNIDLIPVKYEVNEFVGILDDYAGAAAAYSTRKLRSDYSGSALRVRESGGDTELDIGFDSNGNLDTSALLAHCGANNGFITVWYDQSTNGNDAEQSNVNLQPQIVASGVAYDINGKTGINFDTVSFSKGMEMNSRVSVASAFFVYNINAINLVNYILGDDTILGGNNEGLIALGSVAGVNGLTSFIGGTVLSLGNSELTNDDSIGTYIYDGTNSNLNVNEFGYTDVGAQNSMNAKYIGDRRANLLGIDGVLSEVIIYSAEQSANRTGIVSNINNYYAIY